jgi:aspartate ammonia-lyase
MHDTTDSFRTERDALGSVRVPRGALFGAHTARALENFAVSGISTRDRPELIVAFARIKKAAAAVNAEIGEIPADIGGAIEAAADEVVAGRWRDEFPLDIVQGGGGTATHMNVNEVLANRASELLGGTRGSYEPVHPLDHVNRSQSTNDVYPSALALASLELVHGVAESARHLCEALSQKAEESAGLDRIGRTCLQDALPVPVRAFHRAQAAALERTAGDLLTASKRLLTVPLGGTVVGTGFGASPMYREAVVERLGEQTGVPVRRAPDVLDSLAHLDGYAAVAHEVVRLMLAAAKSASDLRLLASGPVGGIGEVVLPAVQVGSSAMPGKVNPVMPELVMQVAMETRGSAAIVDAAAAAGDFEVNVMGPLVARHLLGSLAEVARVLRLFADRCIDGLVWREDVVVRHLAGSRATAVEVARASGYDEAVRRENA